MWFDIEFTTFTTMVLEKLCLLKLWFDIEFTTFTTNAFFFPQNNQLWFDIEFTTFTTTIKAIATHPSCGLI